VTERTGMGARPWGRSRGTPITPPACSQRRRARGRRWPQAVSADHERGKHEVRSDEVQPSEVQAVRDGGAATHRARLMILGRKISAVFSESPRWSKG